jgi:hypothetical protein
MTTPRSNERFAISDSQLVLAWAHAMRELRTRGVTRSSNNPVADFAERLVAEHFDSELVPQSVKGYDVIAKDGTRYKVKSRRVTPQNMSRQISALRDLDSGDFDFVIAVIYDELLQLTEHASFRTHTNSYTVHARGALLADPRVEKLTPRGGPSSDGRTAGIAPSARPIPIPRAGPRDRCRGAAGSARGSRDPWPSRR